MSKRDWQSYASKRLGRKVERTSDGKGLYLTASEIRQITSPRIPLWAIFAAGLSIGPIVWLFDSVLR